MSVLNRKFKVKIHNSAMNLSFETDNFTSAAYCSVGSWESLYGILPSIICYLEISIFVDGKLKLLLEICPTILRTFVGLEELVKNIIMMELGLIPITFEFLETNMYLLVRTEKRDRIFWTGRIK